MLQVADKKFLDGDGCPGLGRARGANHLALNLAVFVDEIHAEIVGHALAHELLDFSHNVLRHVVQFAAEVDGIATDDGLDAVQRV